MEYKTATREQVMDGFLRYWDSLDVDPRPAIRILTTPDFVPHQERDDWNLVLEFEYRSKLYYPNLLDREVRRELYQTLRKARALDRNRDLEQWLPDAAAIVLERLGRQTRALAVVE